MKKSDRSGYGKPQFNQNWSPVKMHKRRIVVGIHIIVPVLIMFTLVILSFSNIVYDAGSLNSMNLIIESLILYYPILFFVQGLVCALLKANILLSLGISLAAYMVIMFMWLNSSGLIYILVYVLMGFLGYSLVLLVKKVMKQ
ncbi:hypothetical protein ACFQU8_01525 [Lentibacillus kimchii]|uniref:Uncharacterized protein n=2 Tax=Lentibacillus kimchii TaxID=1542911 RepID=A0ABW2USC9_9BACI